MSDREDLDELISREAFLATGSAREITNMIVAKGWVGPGEVEALKAELASLNHAISWDTTCLNCASLLDKSIADHERITELEAQVAGLRKMHESSEEGRKHEAKRADKAEQELRQRELHHFETEQENARLKEQVARMQVSLEACPYGVKDHVLCDCVETERKRVETLEKQASSLQSIVEDLEASFETLAVGLERSHSTYVSSPASAREIRHVLAQVAQRAADRG